MFILLSSKERFFHSFRCKWTENPGINRVVWFVLFDAARMPRICTPGRQNNLSINEWHDTGGPSPQVNTPLATYIWRREKSFLWGLNILAGVDGWFERGVKESIYVKLEQPSLNRRGGLRHYISLAYNTALRQLNNHSHLSLPSPGTHMQAG